MTVKLNNLKINSLNLMEKSY